MKKIYLSILSLFILLFADSQSLDKSFNGKGFTTLDFFKGNTNNEVNGQVLAKNDGSFIVLFQLNGFAMYGHYTSDGELDKNFGNEGFSEPLAITEAIGAIQSNGKLVIAGLVFNSPKTQFDFSLARYNLDGTLDKTFGVNGHQTTDFFKDDDIAAAIAIQPNDKIVVAGLAENTATDDADFALARYNANGTPDNSFSGDGKQTTDFSNSDQITSIAIQPDGKIVAAGFSYNENVGFYKIAIARYTSTGTLDNTFDGDGKKVNNFSGGDNYANGVAVQSDGKIIVAGKSYDGTGESSKISVARYNVNGSADNSFSDDGKLLVDFKGVNAAREVVLQPDGKILVGGYKYDPATDTRDFAVLRFNTNGTPDNSFDNDGAAITDFYGGDDVVNDIIVLPDGKLVASGEVFNADVNNVDFGIIKYNSNGTIDKHFGKKGSVIGHVNAGEGRISSLAIQTDGKIIAAGSTYSNNTLGDFALARFNTDGTLDDSFGKDGKVTTDFFEDFDDIVAVAIQPDGKIVAAGQAYDPKTNASEFALARYNSDGSLDKKFGTKGKQTIAILPEYSIASALALQPDGKIIIAGYTIDVQTDKFDIGIARFTSDGLPDNTFDGDGKRTTDISNSDDFVCGMAIQSDGKIVLAGYTFIDNTSEFTAVRYNSDGSYDNSFDGDGKAIFDFGSDVYATGFQLQKDGKLVICGQLYNAPINSFDFVVVRLKSNGTLDNSFDHNGKQITDYGHEDNYAVGLSIQPDGKILVAGSISDSNARMFNVQLTRYNPDGSLDKTFDDDGTLVDNFLHYDQNITCLNVYDNKIYVGGYSFLPGQKGILARYSAGSSLPITKSLQKSLATERSELIVKAHPNPSAQYFTLSLNGGENDLASIKVSDAGGRLIEFKSNITPNTSLLIGAKYKPGIYYVEITQGSSRKLFTTGETIIINRVGRMLFALPFNFVS